MSDSMRSLCLNSKYCFNRFGGGFELMRDGKDTQGVWEIIEGGLK